MLVVLPIFYLSTLTAFLLFLSWLISQQLRTIFLLESQFKYFIDKSQNEILELQESFAFAKVCVAKKCFTRAIIESQQALNNSSSFNILEHKPIISNLYNMLGFIYYEASQLSFAKDFYEKALKIDPNYVVALNNLAKVYEDNQNYVKAEYLYDKVLNINADNRIANSRKKLIDKAKNI